MDKHTEEELKEAEKIADVFMEWFKKNPFEITSMEEQMVSERFKYGGCPDIITPKSIEDIKTGFVSPRNYYELCMQLSAYDQLNHENHNNYVKFGRIIKVDTDKVETVEFDRQFLDHTFLDFLNLLFVYKSRNNFDRKIRELNIKT